MVLCIPHVKSEIDAMHFRHVHALELVGWKPHRRYQEAQCAKTGDLVGKAETDRTIRWIWIRMRRQIEKRMPDAALYCPIYPYGKEKPPQSFRPPARNGTSRARLVIR